ncbi:heme ABC exporter ATP-binding protein CcmA [Candidatus Magnetaquicoccus inordinatus]|uniref:heme ABC exporter ATP-binding protein CcmA n=1 Tax=Candidatus Magnetaquicoccus inordinatus TaxID=2496818 RepID=UPI00102C6F41|nr:heme ABC exporter ATP-binding protein CcmA [Candidatus Magnetaquicoccus inordinatus]
MSNLATPGNPTAQVRVCKLHHAFGRYRVLQGIDLELSAGECVVLLGANGSGKSTLLALLSTRLRVQQGSYHLSGLEAGEAAEEMRGKLLFVGHHTHLYGHLTPVENLLFFADLHLLAVSEEHLRTVVAAVGLEKFADQPVRWFSAGMRKRLALGRMLLLQPELLLLDEPYSALDRQGVEWLNQVLHSYLATGGMLVMASHDPERIAALPHRPLYLRRGQLFASKEEGP